MSQCVQILKSNLALIRERLSRFCKGERKGGAAATAPRMGGTMTFFLANFVKIWKYSRQWDHDIFVVDNLTEI